MNKMKKRLKYTLLSFGGLLLIGAIVLGIMYALNPYKVKRWLEIGASVPNVFVDRLKGIMASIRLSIAMSIFITMKWDISSIAISSLSPIIKLCQILMARESIISGNTQNVGIYVA